MDEKIRNKMIFTIIAFTIFWVIVCIFRVKLLYEQVYALNKQEAVSTFNRNYSLKRWISFHGGVYAPITKDFKENEYIDFGKRGVTTSDGKRLALITPEYALRLRNKFLDKKLDSITKLTSLKAKNPINFPTAWEKKYLLEFSKGRYLKGKFEIDSSDKNFLKAIIPLYSEKSCYSCHKDYKVGEFRGALSIKVPISQFSSFKDKELKNILIGRTFIYFLAILFIVILFKLINRYFDKSVKASNENNLFINGPIIVFKWIASDSWPIEHVSSNVESILGYTKEDWLSEKIKFSEIIHPDDLERVTEEVTRFSKFNDRDFFEQWYRVIKKDGIIIDIYDKTSIIRDKNKNITHYHGYIMDITEQEKMKKEIIKLKNIESLGIVAGGIAHNFNNLLAILQGYIELTYIGNLKDIDVINDTIMKLTDLSNKMLVFSEGDKPVKKVVDNFSLFLEEYINQLLKNKNILLNFKSNINDCSISIDETMFKVAIKNIITNSIEALNTKRNKDIDDDVADKKIEVFVEFIESYEECIYPNHLKHLKITIKDNALVGLNSDELENTLLPYFTTKSNHVGLGLTIVHSIIEKHEGYIDIESNPNKSFSLSIYLPLSVKGDTSKKNITVVSKESDSTQTDNINKQSKKSILIMDDEELILKMAKIILEKNDFEVEIASHGKEALEKYKERYESNESFSLVILDIIIPGGMGGEETAKEILEINKDASIIVSSGYSNSIVLADYKEHGFKGVLPKPYKLNELLDMVNKNI